MKRIAKLIQKCRIAWYFLLSDNKPDLVGCKIKQPIQFMGKGAIKLDGVHVGYWPSPGFFQGTCYLEAREEGAEIIIGNKTIINNGAEIIAEKNTISIGRRCLVGKGFNAVDSDFHGLKVAGRNTGEHLTGSVSVGDDVFIGNNVTVLKGVVIGRGSVVGSGSVVTKSVPEYSLVAGNPARVIRNIVQ